MTVTLSIDKSLKLIGLDKNERSVYKKLLSGGVMTVSQLAKSTNIPRTTIYRICENLSKKNFLEWVVYKMGKKVKAIPPQKLDYIVKQKQNQLENLQKALDNLKELTKISKNIPLTEIRYYKGKSGMKQLIWNTLHAREGIVGYSIYGRKKIVGEKFIEKYILEFKKKSLTDKVLVNEKIFPEVKKALKGSHQQSKDDVRIIRNDKFYISGDTYIYNNIYAVNFWNKEEIIGVEIENEQIVKVQKGIFDILWEISEILK